MRVSLLQTCSSDDPEANRVTVLEMIRDAVSAGADLVLTPEVVNCVSMDRAHQKTVLQTEDQDRVLSAMRDAARDHGIWLLAGSLALKSDPPETRFANRSILMAPDGSIAARYDKLHMFDVAVSKTETYRESAGFAPGRNAVIARLPKATVGLSICYDLRFAYLYRALAQAGAEILTVPSAFSPGTGPAHWQPLLQARAIETGAYVLAPAQTGAHSAQTGRKRRTYGHSLVVSPWGEVLLDAGEETGIVTLDLDMGAVAEARRKLPSLHHDRAFEGP